MTSTARRPRHLVLMAVSLIVVLAVPAIVLARAGGASGSRSGHARAPAAAPPGSASRSAENSVSRSPSARPPSSAKYGGIPSWLPKAKVRVGRIVQASQAHPALAIQGDSVNVHLGQGRVIVTAVGPAVPEEGRFPVPATTPCRFTVSFAAGRGGMPISARSFTILDELGQLHRPRVALSGGGPLPTRLEPGHIVTLTVSAVLPTGGGRLRWAPGGPRPIVSWDFDVEID